MLLASVKGEQATKAAPGSAATAAPAAAAPATTDVATKDEPETGDVTVTEETVTETADAGPLAKASGGSSLFDTPAPEEPAAPAATPAEKPAATGSLFDTPAPEPAPVGNEGARVIALNMALHGSPRDETARYLDENFELEDPEALLDEVYARVGS